MFLGFKAQGGAGIEVDRLGAERAASGHVWFFVWLESLPPYQALFARILLGDRGLQQLWELVSLGFTILRRRTVALVELVGHVAPQSVLLEGR